jgi:ATP-dependent helicase/nuclease subunit B
MVERPNLFALPPGVDFPAELVAGLMQRMAGKPPEALARVTLILNTQRMRRRRAPSAPAPSCHRP